MQDVFSLFKTHKLRVAGTNSSYAIALDESVYLEWNQVSAQ